MFHGLELLAPKKYEIDLSNEILNFDFGQGAAKISKVKVGVGKKHLPTYALSICLDKIFFVKDKIKFVQDKLILSMTKYFLFRTKIFLMA